MQVLSVFYILYYVSSKIFLKKKMFKNITFYCIHYNIDFGMAAESDYLSSTRYSFI